MSLGKQLCEERYSYLEFLYLFDLKCQMSEMSNFRYSSCEHTITRVVKKSGMYSYLQIGAEIFVCFIFGIKGK